MKTKDEDALKINSSVYVLRADTCKHWIFFFLYSLINTWTTKHFPCGNLSVIHLGLLLYLHWPGMAASDLTAPAIKLFHFKLEENKGAIWSHVSVKLKWSSCQIKPTSTQMREKKLGSRKLWFFPGASSLLGHNWEIFLLLLGIFSILFKTLDSFWCPCIKYRFLAAQGAAASDFVSRPISLCRQLASVVKCPPVHWPLRDLGQQTKSQAAEQLQQQILQKQLTCRVF